ncbi:thiamine-binding protein [Leekyejoonella antrihumi]|uniref:Thiamine-binding protein domain-containing protein n=1 Tax=Leekyejoonella antrihumi TaxID=1660198 RepID=A0A563DYW3_9MICO|nr:thiamine-binding protein [Leekyejoonella antrihumi]TWP35450.1 hypothetical protein FGL98_13830 [Leekyejoonella antrihumi]
MQLEAEFTTEPFEGEGDPPAHAVAALEVAQAAGVECDFGPLGTRMTGDAPAVLRALQDVMSTALARGATRVTVQVETRDDVAKAGGGHDH